MIKLRHTLVGMLAITLLAMLIGPYHAAAQTGTKTYEVSITNITNSMRRSSPSLGSHPSGIGTCLAGRATGFQGARNAG